MEAIKIIILFVAPLLLNSSCEYESINTQSIDLCQDLFELEIQESCTFTPARKTVDRFKDAKGFYETVHLSSTWTAITIRPEQLSDKLPTRVVVPCNLPSFNFKEGQELIFSGNLKETFPTENVVGALIEITSLKIRCN
jgi:hypothetical protein